MERMDRSVCHRARRAEAGQRAERDRVDLRREHRRGEEGERPRCGRVRALGRVDELRRPGVEPGVEQPAAAGDVHAHQHVDRRVGDEPDAHLQGNVAPGRVRTVGRLLDPVEREAVE